MTTKTRTITKEVRDVLATIEWDQQGGQHVARIMAGQLERKLYLAVNDVLSTLGGEWNRKLKGHVFSDDAELELELLIETGEYHSAVDIKQALGQFDTPENLAADVIEKADVRAGHRVLEPSAGVGNLIRELLRTELSGEGRLEIVANEIDASRASQIIKVSEETGLRNANYSITTTVGDFLTRRPNGDLFDRVIMNPPFAKQVDVDHVRHAWEFLKPGGRLVAVMSPGWTFRQNKKSVEFKAFVDEFGVAEPNPDNSFAESGTGVRTCTVVLDKPTE